MEINIFIFRRDFRINDNLALNSLIKDCGNKNIYPIFIFNPAQIYPNNNPYFSNNCVQFMIESLDDLDKNIHVNYYEGVDIEILTKLSNKYKIKSIAYNKDYSPFAIKRDSIIDEWASKNGILIITEEDYTLYNMGTIQNNQNKPYQVFTPFYKKSLTLKVNDVHKLAVKSIDVIKHIKKFDYFFKR